MSDVTMALLLVLVLNVIAITLLVLSTRFKYSFALRIVYFVVSLVLIFLCFGLAIIFLVTGLQYWKILLAIGGIWILMYIPYLYIFGKSE